MRRGAFWIGMLCWVAAAQPLRAAAEPPRAGVIVRAALNRCTAQVGDRIRYTVSIDLPAGVDADFPALAKLPEGFSVVDFSPVQKRRTPQGGTRLTRWYDVRTFLAGSFTIAGPTVEYRTKTGRKRRVRCPDLFVEIESVIGSGEAGALRDLQPPTTVRSHARTWVWVGCAAVVLAAIAGAFVYRRWRRRRPSGPPPVPPHERAYAQLEELVKLDLVGQGRVKEFYYRLSDIVRHYIEDRFHLRAPERTTEEFLVEMANSDALSPEHQALVAEFLEHCDLVKYAKYGPSDDEIKAAYSAALRLIDETRPDRASEPEEVEDVAESSNVA